MSKSISFQRQEIVHLKPFGIPTCVNVIGDVEKVISLHELPKTTLLSLCDNFKKQVMANAAMGKHNG